MDWNVALWAVRAFFGTVLHSFALTYSKRIVSNPIITLNIIARVWKKIFLRPVNDLKRRDLKIFPVFFRVPYSFPMGRKKAVNGYQKNHV
jgi:hypothetical protein